MGKNKEVSHAWYVRNREKEINRARNWTINKIKSEPDFVNVLRLRCKKYGAVVKRPYDKNEWINLKNDSVRYEKRKKSVRLNQHSRRAIGKISIDTFQRLYEENIKFYGTLTCILCLNRIIFNDDTIEHKTPVSRNGTNDYNNLGISHKSCNSSKRDKTMEEYSEYKKLRGEL